MAWVKPTNVAAGDAILASKWNQDVVANAAEIDPFFVAWTSHTPTVTSTSGTFTSVSIVSRYVRVGKIVVWNGVVTTTTPGTATGNIHVPLPVTPLSDTTAGSGVEYQSTGNVCFAFADKANNRLTIAKYDGTTIIGAGRKIAFSITYEAA